MRRYIQSPSPRGRRRAAGFSLVEMIVGLAVTAGLLLAIVGVFAAGSKVARVETQVADVQQSLRAGHTVITRLVRMAGRGGLPVALANTPAYQGPSLAFRNEAGVGTDTGQIAVGFAGSPTAVVGSDILIARGVFNTPVYQIDTLDPAAFALLDAGGNPTTDSGLAETGSVVISDTTPTGTPQDLSPLLSSIAAPGIAEALVLVSPIDERIYGVVELDPANSSSVTGQVTVAFKIRGMDHPGYRSLYNSGTGTDPVLPPGLTSAAYVGILEEYRFYVRQATPPRLSMARMFPGTEVPYQALATNAQIDLADNMLDMQVAVAFDTAAGPTADRDGDGDEDEDDMEIFEATCAPLPPGCPNAGVNDDWLFNGASDDETALPWTGGPAPDLFFIRLSLLARTERRERNYQAPLVQIYEDVAQGRVDFWNTFPERMYKRRLRQTVIELRNL